MVRSLSGSGVALRPWREGDADFVFDLYSRWEVQRYLGHEPKAMEGLDEAHALIERLRSRSGPVLGYWAVESAASGALVGTVMLHGIRLSGTRGPSGEVEIGWHFHPNAGGHGYATEAAQLVMQHGFESGLDRIIADPVVHHRAQPDSTQRAAVTAVDQPQCAGTGHVIPPMDDSGEVLTVASATCISEGERRRPSC